MYEQVAPKVKAMVMEGGNTMVGYQPLGDKPNFILIQILIKYKLCNFVYEQVAPKVKAMMMEGGNTMVGYQPLGDKPNFFRMIISNPAATKADLDFLLDEIEKLGEELEL